MTVTAYVGIVAAFCTTVAFVPQIVKLRKQGGEDLSYQMLFLYLTGVLLWLVYGIRVHAVAVIWANALAGLMVLISIVLVISMGIGLFAPPLGLGLYGACLIGGVRLEETVRPIMKYLGILFLCLLLIAFVPSITTVLPRAFGY